MILRGSRVTAIARGSRRLWTPAVIQTALWLDANDASTVTLNGLAISQWADKSGNGRNATQGVSANQPLWVRGQNLLRYSEQMNTGVPYWYTAIPITPDVAVAPDGTLTADRFDNALSSTYQTFTCTPNTAYTFSFFVRLGTLAASDFVFAVRDDTAGVFIGIDLVPSVAVTSTNWARVTYTFTTPAGCTLCRVYPFRNKLGGGNGTFFVWGAQVNLGATADVYQKTELTAQPVVTGINGKPVVMYDGTDDFLSVDGTWAVGTPYHIAAAVMRTSNKANNSLWGGTGSTANSNLIAGWATDTTYRNAQYGNDFTLTVPAYTTPTPVIAGHDLDTAVGRAQYFDGTLAGTRANTATLLSNAGWKLGFWGSNFNGRMGEIVATPYSLSAADRQRLEGYLAWKWGLTANLPASHPYKNTPPLV